MKTVPQHEPNNLKLPITSPSVKAASERISVAVPGASGGDGGPPPNFYPRGPNGGFIVQHRLWNGELHPLEWFFGWEHPDTGEYFAAMPAKLVLEVLDLCAILGSVRPSWIFARSARWKSRVAMYEVRVRTIDWMIEIYYDKENLAQQESDSFQDSNYSRVRPQTREERRIAIRMQHLAAACTDSLCRKMHKPPRPRNRK